MPVYACTIAHAQANTPCQRPRNICACACACADVCACVCVCVYVYVKRL